MEGHQVGQRHHQADRSKSGEVTEYKACVAGISGAIQDESSKDDAVGKKNAKGNPRAAQGA
eukprot:CAMPEP_0184657392 /NCGR_PEP_ID=MMETSP0308-20130426/19183_1 /TAXON_ID=38269 /ORGANISM="Gloeochaete witrockiana, Strain SAG 46.84" /LENGTH=60 /DNA_ID=CAMNT_0027095161 /DNA_START=188 /DNA_END=366 /DNA_ORIENTATION=+